MLAQRLHWLLPVLIVFWTKLPLTATLPAHDERTHVFANTFDSSPAATSTIIAQNNYNKGGHSSSDKTNDVQSSHKLVASPAGLLRPDKFQFYTYNDKGDMITRQMTVEEIQGLIAAGGADHVAMDRQEPQKADDVLTGGKKVMDVVQKVQNVLKSALDKPPTLTGSIPQIPEHANVEWSNILPSILSGETDAISSSSTSNQLSYKITTEKIDSGAMVHATSDESVLNRTNVTSYNTTRNPLMPDIQTNVYAGFSNNMEHVEKPERDQDPQEIPTTGAFTEKPMIPVPVITLTQQKLSTLQSAVTESPVFQILSVIPVEGTHKKNQTDASTIDPIIPLTTEISVQTEEFNQTERFVELSLSKVPENSTYPQLTNLNVYSVNMTNQTGTNLGNDTTEQVSELLASKLSTMKITASPYSTTEPSISTVPSILKQTVAYDEASEATNIPDKISALNTNYILIRNKNNTKPSEDSLFVSNITKESEVNGTNTNILTSISHASAILKPEELANERFQASSNISGVTLSKNETHLPSTSASEIEMSTVPTTLRTDSSVVTGASLNHFTSAHTVIHRDSQTIGVQSITSMEPLPTQLVDSFSSVMNQISETGPSLLSVSSTGASEMSIVNINNDREGNDSIRSTVASTLTEYDTPMLHNINEENAERTVTLQMYATQKVPSQNNTVRIIGHSTTQSPFVDNRESVMNTGNDDASANPRITPMTPTISRIGANETTATDLATTSSGLSIASTNTMTESATSSSVWIQLEEFYNGSLENQTGSFTTFETTTVSDASSWTRGTDKITSFEEILPITPPVGDVAKVQSTTASAYTSELLDKSTSTNKYFDNALINLNWSNPVSAIEQVLNVAPLPSSTPLLEPISLPNDTSNFLASDLASGLIAGFGTSTTKLSSLEEISTDQVAKNAYAIHPTTSLNTTKFAESTENVSQVYEATMEFDVNDGYRKKGDTTYTPIQEPLLSTGNGALGSFQISDSNEKINDSTRVSSLYLLNKTGSIRDESMESTEVVNTERLSTMDVNVQPSNADKTPIPDTVNQDKKESLIRIDTNPGLSQLPIKVGLINLTDINDIGKENVLVRTDNSSKTEMLNRKNDSSANIVSTTQEITMHEQYQEHNVASANESNFGSHSSHEYISDVTTNTDASDVVLNTAGLPDTTTMQTVFSEDLNRVNNATAVTTSIIPSSNNHTYHTTTQSNAYGNDSCTTSSTLLSIQEEANDSAVKIVMQKLSSDASANNESTSRPNLIDSTHYYNSANNTLNQGNKNVEKIGEQLNNTEGKLTSFKQSENLSKPEVTRLQSQTPLPNVPNRQQVTKPAYSHKSSEQSNVSKSDINADVNAEDKWTLISQQIPPTMTKLPKPPKLPKPSRKPAGQTSSNANENINVRSPGGETTLHQQDTPQSLQSVLPLDASQTVSGLDVTVKYTSADITNFAKLCNELAFNFWVATNKGLSTARSLALSPFGMTSLLAMIFLGARGPTSDQMNDVLGLDDVATFNPHLVFQNITDAVSLARGQGIANAAFIRELFADKMKVRKLMPFYKEQAQQFYEGLVAEVNFATISDLVRRRTNLLIRKQTGGRIKDFVKTNTVPLRSPLAALSANVFQTDCNTTLTSATGRDGELYFAVSPAVRQRKLVPVPATTWRSGILAGYEPGIDATAVALGGSDKLVSTIFVLPGQQGHAAPGDTLDRLEQRLVRGAFRDGIWNKLLKVLIPRNGLELQVPKFSHRSVVNATAALKRMGLDELFSGNADFKGINGVGHRLYLADVLQMNLFSTCGDENILTGRHHVETYPASPLRNIRQRIEDTNSFGNAGEDDGSRHDAAPYQRESHTSSFYASQLRTDRFHSREKRQITKSSERPRLKLDRPFLYFVRHNPSGIILHMGRFNPRLLP